jgi:hypothetical protein
MTYPNPDGSSYNRAPGPSSENTDQRLRRRPVTDREPQLVRRPGQVDPGACSTSLNGGQPITTKTTE